VLNESRSELDAVDAGSNVYPGDRAALVGELRVCVARPANVIPVGEFHLWANRSQNSAQPQISALQTAAE
jgi:hypothetical protein